MARGSLLEILLVGKVLVPLTELRLENVVDGDADSADLTLVDLDLVQM
jgi:hypothetical protein